MAANAKIKAAVVRFLKENPKPTDHAIHGLAAALGVDKHKFEELIYQMLGEKLNKSTKKNEGTMSKVKLVIRPSDDLIKAGGEGSRGGTVTGHDASGKPVYGKTKKKAWKPIGSASDGSLSGYELHGHHSPAKIKKDGKKWHLHYQGQKHEMPAKKPSLDHAEGKIKEVDAAAAKPKKKDSAHDRLDAAADRYRAIKDRQKARRMKKSTTEDLYKSLVQKGEALLKGYPTNEVTGWANQFYGSPYRVEALKLLKERSECSEERDKEQANDKTWREIENMALEARTAYRQERAVRYAVHEKKHDAIVARQSALQTKLIDHQIAQAERDAASMAKSTTDDLEKAGEGSKGGKVVGHDASGKAIYAHHNKTGAMHRMQSDLHHKRALEEANIRRSTMHMKLSAMHKDAADSHDKAKDKHKEKGDHSNAANKKTEGVEAAHGRMAARMQGDGMKKSLDVYPIDHQVEGLPFNLSAERSEDMSKSFTHGQESFGAGELIDEMVDIKQAGANGGMPGEDLKDARERVYHEPETVIVEHAGTNSPYGRSH